MEVNARIIDVESASIITAESVKSTTAIKLEDLVVQMAEKIIKESISPVGRYKQPVFQDKPPGAVYELTEIDPMLEETKQHKETGSW